MKLVDRLQLSSINMAVKLNFTNLLKRINDITKWQTAVDKTLASGIVTSVNGDAGDVSLSLSTLSGTVPTSRGGTSANLSATGPGVLRQLSSGAAVTVSKLAANDLTNGTTGSGAVVLANGPTLGSPYATGTLSAADVAVSGTATLTRAKFTTGDVGLDNGTTFSVRAYLRAYADAAGRAFGTRVAFPLRLYGAGSYTVSTLVSNLTNCTVSRSDMTDDGFTFTITSSGAGDCSADVIYSVRGNS